MDIKLEGSKTIKANALVVGEFEGKSLSKDLKSLDGKLNGLLKDAINGEKFEFKSGETLVLRTNGYLDYEKLILVGLGAKSDFSKKSERKAIASAVRKAQSEKIEKLAFENLNSAALIAETAILVSYKFDKYKTNGSDKKKYSGIKKLSILGAGTSSKVKALVEEAKIIANATCLARDLVWEPACVATPSYLASVARKISGAGIKVNIKNKKDCEKLKMGSYLAVSQGSDEPPKFIEITYSSRGKVKKHIAIVGKGVTFDSGGLSLKPAKSMEMMKEDMSGAAAALGIMQAISKLKPQGLKITMIVAATENMPSGKAYRPGDVIKAMNGKTIEVNNTDAEGRLTLADAVAYVSKKNPDEIIDMATLTGACLVALGNECAGLMTNNEKLLERVRACADEQAELMWQLPLYDEYKKKLKSTIADLKNAGSGGQAGAQNGGLFVQEFVGNNSKGKQIPWLHIDIAGPCWLDEDSDWSPKGASGIGVRTLVNYILSH